MSLGRNLLAIALGVAPFAWLAARVWQHLPLAWQGELGSWARLGAEALLGVLALLWGLPVVVLLLVQGLGALGAATWHWLTRMAGLTVRSPLRNALYHQLVRLCLRLAPEASEPAVPAPPGAASAATDATTQEGDPLWAEPTASAPFDLSDFPDEPEDAAPPRT